MLNVEINQTGDKSTVTCPNQILNIETVDISSVINKPSTSHLTVRPLSNISQAGPTNSSHFIALKERLRHEQSPKTLGVEMVTKDPNRNENNNGRYLNMMPPVLTRGAEKQLSPSNKLMAETTLSRLSKRLSMYETEVSQRMQTRKNRYAY